MVRLEIVRLRIVRVAASCSPEGGGTIAAGSQRWLVVEVPPGSCRITFEPSPPGGFTTPVASSLDVLAWRPR